MPKTLVYVDDSADDLFLFRSACKLAKARFQLVEILGGPEAMLYLDRQGSYADRNRFPEAEILLLDLKMPDVDGFALLRHFRSDPARKRCPVGLLTSSTWPADIQQARDLGATWYFQKPPDMSHLIEFVRVLDECVSGADACADMESRLSGFSR